MTRSAAGVKPFLVRDRTGARASPHSIFERVTRVFQPEVGRLDATPHTGNRVRRPASIKSLLLTTEGIITLSPPKIGIAEAQSSDFAQCARLASDAELQRLVRDGLDDYSPDNSTAYDIQTAVLRLGLTGIHAEVWGGDPMMLAAQRIPQGCYLVVGINCTPDCIPVAYNSGIRHWLAMYSTAGDCYNCWFAELVRYTNLSECHNFLMGTVVIWKEGFVPVDNPVPLPVPVPVIQQLLEAEMSAVAIVPRFGGKRVDVYKVDGSGNLTHLWPPDANGTKHHEQLGADGSLNKPTGWVPNEVAAINVNGVTYVAGRRSRDGLLEVLEQADFGGTWIGSFWE